MGHEADLSKGSCDSASTEDPGAQRTPGYVIRTDVLKRSSRAFINVCGNEGIGRPFYRDLKNLWTVPHGLAGPKEDPAGKRPDKCRVYDFVVNPSTLRMVEASASFRKAVNDLAVEGVSKQFSVRLDKKHLVFPDMSYKGAVTNVFFVEKLAQVSVENCGNELNEFFSSESCKDMICFDEETDNSYTTCLQDGKSAKMSDNEIEAGELGKSLTNGCFSDEKFIEYTEENSGPDVNLKNMSSAERILENSVDVSDLDLLKAVENNDNLPYSKVEDSGYVLPAYESFQDKVSVTFIFDVRKVNGKDASLIVRSSQEILLRMVTSVENELPLLHYQCCLKFGNKCRFVEDGCRLDVSETNVVLTIAKAEKSQVTWHAYFIGTSFQHLDVRDFASIDGLKRHLDALDMVSASPPGSVCEDEEITKDTKAEEKELEDVVPGEIVVIHERRTPKLHGILKQRSISESSDDLSPWSYSLDRLVSAATCSDTESEGFEDGPVRFRPCFKKSVSFSEQIDEAMFVVNQSVSQMHQALKNKRRRMRKREQKHELKEARRRCRSSSESCSTTQDDQDFVSELLSAEKHRAFLYGEKAAWNLTRNAAGGTTNGGESHDDSGSESASHTDEDCTDKKTDVEENAFNEDVVEDGSCRTDVHEVCENLDGTRDSVLELIPEKTSLETCGRTSNGGTPSLVGGAKQSANLDDVVVGDTNAAMLSYKIDPGTSHDDASVASRYDEGWGSLENKVEFSQRKSAFVDDGDHSAFKLCDDKPVSSVESNGLKNNGDGFVVNDPPLTSIVND